MKYVTKVHCDAIFIGLKNEIILIQFKSTQGPFCLGFNITNVTVAMWHKAQQLNNPIPSILLKKNIFFLFILYLCVFLICVNIILT